MGPTYEETQTFRRDWVMLLGTAAVLCRAYNMSGRQGVRLVLRDGSRILAGTKRPDELARAVEQARASR